MIASMPARKVAAWAPYGEQAGMTWNRTGDGDYRIGAARDDVGAHLAGADHISQRAKNERCLSLGYIAFDTATFVGRKCVGEKTARCTGRGFGSPEPAFDPFRADQDEVEHGVHEIDIRFARPLHRHVVARRDRRAGRGGLLLRIGDALPERRRQHHPHGCGQQAAQYGDKDPQRVKLGGKRRSRHEEPAREPGRDFGCKIHACA
jgi:hypothetical protein